MYACMHVCMYVCMYSNIFLGICSARTDSERVQVVNAQENLFHMLGSILLRVRHRIGQVLMEIASIYQLV